jgi:peptidoglycan/LPS O-acetylase OafA/YrhL
MNNGDQLFNKTSLSKNDNLNYVDLLRGLAIIGVLLSHCTIGMAVVGLKNLPFNIDWLMHAGRHGVALFFVVSAYTLMRSMANRIESEYLPTIKYFLRRFFRIAPAYYVVLLIVFFVDGVGFFGYSNPQNPTLTWNDLFAHLFFINGFFPYYTNNFLAVEWSISTEILFYTALPIIFFLIRKIGPDRYEIWKVIGLYLLSILFLWGMFYRGEYLKQWIGYYPADIFNSWTYFFILTHLHEFIIGIAVWVFLNNTNTKLKHADKVTAKQEKNLINWQLLIIFLIGISFVYVEYFYADNFYIMISGLMMWGILSGALIYFLDIQRPRQLPIISYFGKISFSLYLIHFPVFNSLTHLKKMWAITTIAEINFIIYAVIGILTSLCLATLLYYLIERQGMRFGRFVISFIQVRNR